MGYTVEWTTPNASKEDSSRLSKFVSLYSIIDLHSISYYNIKTCWYSHVSFELFNDHILKQNNGHVMSIQSVTRITSKQNGLQFVTNMYISLNSKDLSKTLYLFSFVSNYACFTTHCLAFFALLFTRDNLLGPFLLLPIYRRKCHKSILDFHICICATQIKIILLKMI